MPPSVICRHSCLATDRGDEFFLSIKIRKTYSFSDALQKLGKAYQKFRQELGLGEDSEIWLRFFLSDIANQISALQENWKVSPTALLCPIGQAPACSEYVSLLAYHVRGDSLSKENWSRNGLLFHHGVYTSMLGNYIPTARGNAETQTDEIIERLLADLRHSKASLARDIIRTWYYIRDVDNNYLDMIASRRRYYEAEGLRPDTRFIASTGIEGSAPDPWVFSWMSILGIQGLAPEQSYHLKALDNLSPTNVYGVNFERATRVDFGDRSHIHLSGTASIDRHGQVVHLGNVTKQYGRTVDNIMALLDEGGMSLGDMCYAIVYLRDPAEAAKMEQALADNWAEIPMVMVHGAVCRTSWLVEIEGLAGSASSSGKNFAPYL